MYLGKLIYLFALVFLMTSAVYAVDPLGVSITTSNTVILGDQDPVSALIFNDAPVGSATLNYSVFDAFPYGNSPNYFSSRAADGGSGYSTVVGDFDTSRVNAGTYTVSVTATNTDTGKAATVSTNVLVLAHAVPAFNVGGEVQPLPRATFATAEPSVDPLAFGATGGGENFASSAPSMIGDPVAPTAEMDLDSITAIGDSQITLTLQPFTDLVADDDPAHGVPFQIDVDGSVPGDYFTMFELNYSDEQDLPGADAPGSEHAYFGVHVTVTADGVTGGIVVPEPGTFGLLAIGVVSLLPLLRRARRAALSPCG